MKKLFNTLHGTVKKEAQATEDLLKLQGALEMIFATSNISLPPIDNVSIDVELKKD